jgi:cytochrome c-type biogenesis protein CcmH/NrfG
LAAGEFDLALAAFRQAEQSFLAGDETKSLMAHGYIALARKADPRSRVEGAEALNEALERLRVNGSKEALFFADQLATADRVLIG